MLSSFVDICAYLTLHYRHPRTHFTFENGAIKPQTHPFYATTASWHRVVKQNSCVDIPATRGAAWAFCIPRYVSWSHRSLSGKLININGQELSSGQSTIQRYEEPSVSSCNAWSALR